MKIAWIGARQKDVWSCEMFKDVWSGDLLGFWKRRPVGGI